MGFFKKTGGLDDLYNAGDKVGRLTLGKKLYDEKGYRAIQATCDCGVELIIRLKYLKAGTVSCGCHRKSYHSQILKTCGLSKQ